MLKNLKSLFIIEDKEEKVETEDNTQKSPQSAETAKASNLHISETTVSAVVDKLFSSIEENNQPGFDYFEYKSALKSMEKMPMDEPTKFQSTFATASTLGITIDKLIESANFYLKVLANEESKFISASDQQFKNNIDKKIEEIELFKKLIEDKNAEIQKLNDEISNHYGKLEALNQHITESKNKIEQTKGSFEMAYVQIKSQIESDIEKINKYLK